MGYNCPHCKVELERVVPLEDVEKERENAKKRFADKDKEIRETDAKYLQADKRIKEFAPVEEELAALRSKVDHADRVEATRAAGAPVTPSHLRLLKGAHAGYIDDLKAVDEKAQPLPYAEWVTSKAKEDEALKGFFVDPALGASAAASLSRPAPKPPALPPRPADTPAPPNRAPDAAAIQAAFQNDTAYQTALNGIKTARTPQDKQAALGAANARAKHIEAELAAPAANP